MRSAGRLLPLILLLSACGGAPRASSAAATDTASAPLPPVDSAATATQPAIRGPYSGYDSRHDLLQALADSAAKEAALGTYRMPISVGGYRDTTRLLAYLGPFTLARYGGPWHAVWAAVNGSVVLVDTTAGSARVVLAGPWWETRSVALVELAHGARCPVAYRLVEYSAAQRPTVSPEFGNCARPVVTRDARHLRMRFPALAQGRGTPARAAAEYEYLGHGRIRRRGEPAPPEYPDSLYDWGDDAARAIAGTWRGGRFAAPGGDTTDLLALVATPAGTFTYSKTFMGDHRPPRLRAAIGTEVVMSDSVYNYADFAALAELGGDLALLGNLETEFHRTTDAVLKIRNTEHLLRDTPVLQSAIGLRNPYVDPLSLLQIALLKKKRSLPEGENAEREKVESVLATTLSGIAQGLRNTG